MHVHLWAGGLTLTLPDYWQSGKALPDDVAGAQAFGYKFHDGAPRSL
jgi:hypothetical protein